MAIIRPMGFNAHTARAIVFGSRRLGGIGITPGYTKQGSEGVVHFLAHVQSNTRLGRLMLNTLSQLQLLSGQSEGLLSHPRPLPATTLRKGSNVYRWHHLARGWLLSLRHYLHEIGGRILLPNAWTPMLTRTNNITIMDALRTSCSLSESQLALTNSVRLFLRVLTLSDITS